MKEQITQTLGDEGNLISITEIKDAKANKGFGKDEILLDPKQVIKGSEVRKKSPKFRNNNKPEKISPIDLQEKNNLYAEIQERKSVENYKIYLQSQNLFKKLFKLYEPQFRSNSDICVSLKQKNFVEVFNNQFNKNIIQKTLASVIFEEFAFVGHHTNACLVSNLDRYLENNSGIIPVKFFKVKKAFLII